MRWGFHFLSKHGGFVMDRCINEKPLLGGIDSRIMIPLLTIGAVSLFSIESVQTIIACLLIFIITKVLYWYEPLFFLFIGSYLRMTDLNVLDQFINGGKPFGNNLLWKGDIGTYGPGIILQNMDGSFQITFSLTGIDFASEYAIEIAKRFEDINSGLKLLSDYEVTIFWECRRSNCVLMNESLGLDMESLPYALKGMMNEKTNLIKNTNLFNNEHILTVSFKPKPAEQGVSKLTRFFISSSHTKQTHPQEQDIEKFKELLDKFTNVLSQSLELTALNKEQTAEYLHSCISTKSLNSDILKSENESDWANFLPDQQLHKGLNPMLDNKFVKAVGIVSFPESFNPEMRNEIGRIPGEFRWVIRADFLNSEKAMKIVKNKKIAWANSSINLGAVVGSLFTGGGENTTGKLESKMAERLSGYYG